MQFDGSALQALATGEVVIPRPDGAHLSFLVRALAYGEDNEALRVFPDAKAAFGFLKDAEGNPLRDESTGKVVHGPLYDDPGYIKNQEHAEDMRVVVKIVLSLDHDDRITWSTGQVKGSKEYYEDIRKELRNSGLTLGDLHLVLRKANELGNCDQGALERAAEAFSEREQAKADLQQPAG